MFGDGGKFGLGFADGGKVLKQGFLKDRQREELEKEGAFRKTKKMGGATKEKERNCRAKGHKRLPSSCSSLFTSDLRHERERKNTSYTTHGEWLRLKKRAFTS